MDTKTRSEAQIEASRRNGARSTGPVTEAGKNKSRLNALKHGIFLSKELLLPEENPETYETLRQALFEEFDPQTPFEAVLVESVVNCTWKLHRIEIATRDILSPERVMKLGRAFSSSERALSQFDRHDRSLQRKKNEDLKQFLALRKQRVENGQNEPKIEFQPLAQIGPTREEPFIPAKPDTSHGGSDMEPHPEDLIIQRAMADLDITDVSTIEQLEAIVVLSKRRIAAVENLSTNGSQENPQNEPKPETKCSDDVGPRSHHENQPRPVAQAKSPEETHQKASTTILQNEPELASSSSDVLLPSPIPEDEPEPPTQSSDFLIPSDNSDTTTLEQLREELFRETLRPMQLAQHNGYASPWYLPDFKEIAASMGITSPRITLEEQQRLRDYVKARYIA